MPEPGEVHRLGGEVLDCVRIVVRDAVVDAARRTFGLVRSPETEQLDHVVALQRVTVLAHQLGDPGSPLPDDRGLAVDRPCLEELRELLERQLERHLEMARRQTVVSERHGLTLHDLRVGDYLATRIELAQRTLHGLESSLEEA